LWFRCDHVAVEAIFCDRGPAREAGRGGVDSSQGCCSLEGADAWRGESSSSLRRGGHLSHLLCAGLGHPAHPFLLGLLEEWKIGPHHLNPTGMLHIAGFVTVCEAFLGIDPHVDIFQEMFVGRPVTLRREARTSRSETTITPVGGFGLQQRPGKTSYPRYIPVDSNRGWHDEWFYIRNPSRREEAFPAFTRSAPEKQDSWIWGASRRKKNNVGAIEEVLQGLVARGLDGARVFATIFLRRVRDLSARRGKMWDYERDEPQAMEVA